MKPQIYADRLIFEVELQPRMGWVAEYGWAKVMEQELRAAQDSWIYQYLIAPDGDPGLYSATPAASTPVPAPPESKTD